MNNGEEQVELSIVKGSTSGLLTLTDTGIELAEDTSYEQWQEGLRTIKWFRNKLTIGLADYLAFGNAKFGKEKVEQCLEQLEFEATMVKTAVAINTIPPELRFPNLVGEHYVELSRAKIPRDKQVEWARIASDQELTPSQLRLSIPAGEVVDKAASRALAHGVVTIHGIRQEFDIWLRKVGGVDGIMALEQDYIDEIRGELQAILVLGKELEERIAQSEATA